MPSGSIPSDGVHVLEREQVVPVSLDDAFEFFADALNLERITPPWLHFRVLTPSPLAMGEGAVIEYGLRLHGLPVRWRTLIEEWDPGRSFVDRQIRGPYRIWHHRHDFAAHPGGTLISDRVTYALPLGPFGSLAHRLFVARDLRAIFDFRRDAVARGLAAPASRG